MNRSERWDNLLLHMQHGFVPVGSWSQSAPKSLASRLRLNLASERVPRLRDDPQEARFMGKKALRRIPEPVGREAQVSAPV